MLFLFPTDARSSSSPSCTPLNKPMPPFKSSGANQSQTQGQSQNWTAGMKVVRLGEEDNLIVLFQHNSYIILICFSNARSYEKKLLISISAYELTSMSVTAVDKENRLTLANDNPIIFYSIQRRFKLNQELHACLSV